MSNGKQLAESNLATFVAWATGKTDTDYRDMTHRGLLSRSDIAKECGFAKSVLHQNPRVKQALQALEDDLRSRNVLPPAVPRDPEAPLLREPGRLRATLDGERLRRLEQENASLRAEVAELRRRLEQHSVLREALALTGRLPR